MRTCTRCGRRLYKPFVVRVFHDTGEETELRNKWPRNLGDKVYVALHEGQCTTHAGKLGRYVGSRRPVSRPILLPTTILEGGRTWKDKDVEVRRRGNRFLMILPGFQK